MHARGDDGDEVVDVFRQASIGRVPVDQPQSARFEAVADRAGDLPSVAPGDLPRIADMASSFAPQPREVDHAVIGGLGRHVHSWPSHLDHSGILEINWQIGPSGIGCHFSISIYFRNRGACWRRSRFSSLMHAAMGGQLAKSCAATSISSLPSGRR
jgi:hypothetical protein